MTIFGHGFTRSREDFIAIAGGLADPRLGPLAMVTIATDVLDHGERSSCTGSAAATVQSSDDAACAEPTTQKCDEDPLVGRCVARDPTTRMACTPGAAGDQLVRGGGSGRVPGRRHLRGRGLPPRQLRRAEAAAPQLVPFQRPVISGWNVLNLTNFFSTRDNFRQQVIDLAQLVRVLKCTAATNLAAQASAAAGRPSPSTPRSSATSVRASGGILGTLYNAVSPGRDQRGRSNVPGGRAAADHPQRALLRAVPAGAAAGARGAGDPAVGTPAFDQFIGIAQWILDPADPANMGWRLTHPVDLGGGVTAPNAEPQGVHPVHRGRPDRAQRLEPRAGRGRRTGPSCRRRRASAAAAPLSCYEFTEAGDGFDATSAPLANRHGFLLAPPSATAAGLALTAKAQTQVATFLALGQLP